MTIELAILISVLSFILSLVQAFLNFKKNNKLSTEKDTSMMTTVIVKLENIGNDINEIKTELRDMKFEIKDHDSRIIRLEQKIEDVCIYNNGGNNDKFEN